MNTFFQAISFKIGPICAAGISAFSLSTAHAIVDPLAAPALLRNATVAGVNAQCVATLKAVAAQTLKIEAIRATPSAPVFAALNRLSQTLILTDGEVSIVGGVHPNKKVRDAAEACSVKLTADQTARQQRPKLYALIKGLQPADAIEAKLKQDMVDAFEDTGVQLPAAQKERFKAIADELTKLSTEYDRNIRDFKGTMTFTGAELQGVPEDFLKAAKKDAAGNYVIGFTYPESDAIMTLAGDEEARARYSLANAARGGKRNLEILEKVLTLRQELATIAGQPDYSTFIVRRRMAKDPAAVEKFLSEVFTAVREPMRAEIDEITREKSTHLGKSLTDTKYRRTDNAFYQERIRKARFSIDQEALRAYFPTEASVQWILKVSSDLYGIRFNEVKEKLWHPEARSLRVSDAASNEVLGTIHLDIFPREGKYNHAAVFPIHFSSSLANQLPRNALVTNFNRKGLDQQELETLVHEFGHALHGVLSRTRYADQAGTSVERDFVEAPSQMFEEWARRPESLKLFESVCATCPKLSNEMIDRLNQARQYGQAMRYARQYQYAKYDLGLNRNKGVSPMVAWKASENEMPWGDTGTEFPGQFGHLMGYASAYYGYMWSEVMALDMLSAYKGNLMDKTVGKRYRDIILARGSERPAADMVREFLGREPGTEAFFKEITGKRTQ
jgi:thimet oligopeptidase